MSLAQKSHTFPLYTAPGTCCTGNVLKVIILCSVESDENFFFLQESESTSWMYNKNENFLILKFDFTAWIVGKLPFPVLQLSCTNKSDNFKIRKQFKMFNWNKCNEVCALCLHFRDLLLKREMLKVSPHTRLNYKQSSKNEDNFQRNESQNVVFPEYCATQHCCPF